jgi:DNA-binding beta-propeller fold protein YncE
VYLSDAGSQQIDEYTTSGALISTFTSTGNCVLGQVRDATADPSGNVYAANYLSNDIVIFAPSGACLGTFGRRGSGPGQFANPYGVDVSWDSVIGAEAVYVADSNNNRVQEFLTDGTFVAAIGSPGTADGQFVGLRRVAVATDGSGDVWAADMWGYRVEHFQRTAAGYSFAAALGDVPPPLTPTQTYNQPHAVDLDSSGNLYTMDTVNQRVVETQPDGSTVRACGQRGFGQAGDFNWPRGVAVDQASGNIWIADTKQNDVQVIQADCTPLLRIQNPKNPLETFSAPSSLAFRDSDGTIWLADTGNNRVVSFDAATGQPVASFGGRGSGAGDFNSPSGVAVDPTTGRIVVADTANSRLVELTDTGGGAATFYANVSCAGVRPTAVAVDPAGRFVVLSGSRLFVCGQDGTLLALVKSWSTPSGPDGFGQPTGLAVDSQGDIFVADTFHDRLVEFSIASVSLSPATANAQQTVSLTGQGFGPGEPVEVTFDGQPWLGLGADSTGAVSDTQATIPALPDGTYVVAATGSGSGIVARTTVTVQNK